MRGKTGRTKKRNKYIGIVLAVALLRVLVGVTAMPEADGSQPESGNQVETKVWETSSNQPEAETSPESGIREEDNSQTKNAGNMEAGTRETENDQPEGDSNQSGTEVQPANSDAASFSTVESAPESIPAYAVQDYVLLNDGIPNFTTWDLENITGESYSELDSLGRCGVAVAMLEKSMMPTGERGSIGQIKPTGWVQEKYEGFVDSNPPYLYNRCHLIAYGLTGQNVNEKNLITGTRYMNATAMLPWERQVMQYLEVDGNENHVLYRVTPYFAGTELLARGVELEAYSVEDAGAGICFHVFVYNVQPGIKLDYETGDSWIAE